MKSIKTLIKLYRRILDEKRIELVKEQEFRDEVEEILLKQRAEMNEEKNLAGSSFEASFSYAPYFQRATKKEEKIISVIKQQDQKIEAISDEIFNLFGEVKRYEIISDIKEKEQEKEENRQEQIILDEVAINTHIRKKEV